MTGLRTRPSQSYSTYSSWKWQYLRKITSIASPIRVTLMRGIHSLLRFKVKVSLYLLDLMTASMMLIFWGDLPLGKPRFRRPLLMLLKKKWKSGGSNKTKESPKFLLRETWWTSPQSVRSLSIPMTLIRRHRIRHYSPSPRKAWMILWRLV